MKASIANFLLIPIILYGCNAVESANDARMASNAASSSPDPAGQPGPAPQPDPAGHVHFEGNWQGTLTSDLSQTSSPAIAMVNGWGEFRLISDGAQFVGWPRRTAKNVVGTVTGIRAAGSTWNDGTTNSIFELDGDISEDDFIEASYAGGGESGTLSLAWDADTESRIESIGGTWVQHDDNSNIVATFQIEAYNSWQAKIFGSHVNGCTYAGETEAWTSRYSYDVVPFEASGCPPVAGSEFNGTWSGTGALIDLVDDASEEPALVLALSIDLQHQVTLFLYRVAE